MTTEKNKVSELLVSDEQLLGPRHDAIGEDDFYPERMSYWAIRAIYEAELARLRQERDELVGALRLVGAKPATMGFYTGGGLSSNDLQHIYEVLSKHKPE